MKEKVRTTAGSEREERKLSFLEGFFFFCAGKGQALLKNFGRGKDRAVF
jgi:hypothetical protein